MLLSIYRGLELNPWWLCYCIKIHAEGLVRLFSEPLGIPQPPICHNCHMTKALVQSIPEQWQKIAGNNTWVLLCGPTARGFHGVVQSSK